MVWFRFNICTHNVNAYFHRLVPDLTEDDYPSSKSDSSDQEDDPHQTRHRSSIIAQHTPYALAGSVINNNHHKPAINGGATSVVGLLEPTSASAVSKSSDEDDDIGDGLQQLRAASGAAGSDAAVAGHHQQSAVVSNVAHAERCGAVPHLAGSGQVERRRRKLPEIPKHRKCKR